MISNIKFVKHKMRKNNIVLYYKLFQNNSAKKKDVEIVRVLQEDEGTKNMSTVMKFDDDESEAENENVYKEQLM